MEGNFSNRVQDVIRLSRLESLRVGCDFTGTEHLLLGIIREGEGIAIKLLRELKVDTLKLKKAIENAAKSSGTGKQIEDTGQQVPLTKQAEKVLKITYLEAKIYKSDVIGTEHLLLSLLRDEDSSAAIILDEHNVTYDAVKGAYDTLINGALSKAVAKGFSDPALYESLCEPFDSQDEFSEAAGKFSDEVRALRKKYGLADVTLLMSSPYMKDGKEEVGIITGHNGSGEMMLTMIGHAYNSELRKIKSLKALLESGEE